MPADNLDLDIRKFEALETWARDSVPVDLFSYPALFGPKWLTHRFWIGQWYVGLAILGACVVFIGYSTIYGTWLLCGVGVIFVYEFATANRRIGRYNRNLYLSIERKWGIKLNFSFDDRHRFGFA